MRVFVVAGEASGDKLGAALMAGLKEAVPDVTFVGIGGERMIEKGLDSLFPMAEISIMGITEILSQYRALKGRIRQTVGAVIETQPDVLITIDLPEFGLRVAKQVKARSDIRTVHYVAPTVWAWRPGRARKMAAYIDQVLALFPFEPPYMEAEGMRCDFVGHPVVTDPVATQADEVAFRAKSGIGDAPMVLLLPGSRRSEISRLMPVFEDVVKVLHAQRPHMHYVLPTAPNVAKDVRAAVATWETAPILIDPDAADQKRAAFSAADVAIAASGTVSLELAAVQTPMVIAYDMNWVSRQIIGRLLRVDTVTLVNLVADTRVVPEFIGKNCVPQQISQAVLDTLDDPTAQTAAMALTMTRLGRGGDDPGARAARAVLEGLAQKSQVA